jgi:uncharacterized protein (DUF433 family)
MGTVSVSAFEGIYDVPSAARYLIAGRMKREAYPVSSRTLIRWIRQGLALPQLAEVPSRELLITFEDLVSMRVIAALRAYGVSWPKIRRAEHSLRKRTGHGRPFATEYLWTDPTGDVFSEFSYNIITESRDGQLALDIIREYLIPINGLAFEEGVASTWEPMSLVTFDPEVQFGAPCIKGTRIPTRAVWGMVQAGDTLESVERAYRITEDELRAALKWEDALAAA